MTTIGDITAYLEELAPLSYQESYDNSGLLVGQAGDEVSGILVCLDCTEDVIAEAVRHKCNLVIAHHPVIFSGLKRITGRSYVERTVRDAIRNNVSIYAIHTNLDNIIRGVNSVIAARLGLHNTKILQPKPGVLSKLVTYVPKTHADAVRDAMFRAGAGAIGNYDECSFNISGTGTFRPNEDADPFSGEIGKRKSEDEIRVEVLLEQFRAEHVIRTMIECHPYEEVAYDLFPLANSHSQAGAGMIGELAENEDAKSFLVRVKEVLRTGMIRHTKIIPGKVRKVAVCGGSGSFLLKDAIRQGADVFITGDFKYHQFFDAEDRIIIADIGHYESEQFTMELIKGHIMRKFSTFAVRLTEVNTNPVHYM